MLARLPTYIGALVGASIGRVAESLAESTERSNQTQNYAAIGARIGVFITCAVTEVSVLLNFVLKSALALQLLVPFIAMTGLFFVFSYASWNYDEAMESGRAEAGSGNPPGPQTNPPVPADSVGQTGAGARPQTQASGGSEGGAPSEAAGPSAGKRPESQASGATAEATAGQASKDQGRGARFRRFYGDADGRGTETNPWKPAVGCGFWRILRGERPAGPRGFSGRAIGDSG